MTEIDPHKTKFTAPLAVAFAMGAAIVAGSWVSAAKLTSIDHDINDLKARHVFSSEEIRELIRTRVDDLWKQKRANIRIRCSQFPSRGIFDDCTEVAP